MKSASHGKTESGITKLSVCVPEPEEISGTDQGSSSESRDIREAKGRHPSQRFKQSGSEQYVREL
jgi:hypothetical protein